MKKSVLAPLILLVAALVLVEIFKDPDTSTPSRALDASASRETVTRAFEARGSDVEVEGEGVVFKIFPDDQEGRRHQKFLVRLANGQSLLISHNIDLAQRVPLQVGDSIAFRGRYEWNDRGGLVHWTHHDPSGRRLGGWLVLNGTTYQ